MTYHFRVRFPDRQLCIKVEADDNIEAVKKMEEIAVPMMDDLGYDDFLWRFID